MDARITGLLLVAVALAGCSGDEDTGPSAEEQCALDERLWTGTECVDHTEPHIMLDGLESTVPAYATFPFNWKLENGTRHHVHSMYNTIQATSDGTIPDNTTDGETSPIGVELVTKTHQDLPTALEGTFAWDTPGETVTLWGYMRIEGEHIWQQLLQVQVTAPLPTGVTHTVTIALDPASGGITHDGNEVTMAVGDAVSFSNGLPFDYTIDLSDCGEGTVTASGQGSSEAVTFLAPQNCDWTGASPLGATGTDPAGIGGSLRIRA